MWFVSQWAGYARLSWQVYQIAAVGSGRVTCNIVTVTSLFWPRTNQPDPPSASNSPLHQTPSPGFPKGLSSPTTHGPTVWQVWAFQRACGSPTPCVYLCVSLCVYVLVCLLLCSLEGPAHAEHMLCTELCSSPQASSCIGRFLTSHIVNRFVPPPLLASLHEQYSFSLKWFTSQKHHKGGGCGSLARGLAYQVWGPEVNPQEFVNWMWWGVRYICNPNTGNGEDLKMLFTPQCVSA